MLNVNHNYVSEKNRPRWYPPPQRASCTRSYIGRRTTKKVHIAWQPPSSGDFDVPLWSKTGTEVQTYIVDGNKNVRQLKNAAGTVIATNDYDPFGNVTATGSVTPWQFSSEYHDAETGLVYYNYCHYAPTIGRWLTRDPIGEDGSMNLYWQNTNDPINAWDFRGMWKSTNTDIWEAESGDSLWKLAKEITGQGADWQCIWPICYNGDKDQYPNSIQVGDTFDVSNLTAKDGTNLYVSIASTDTAFGKAYTILRPQAVLVSDNDTFHSEIKRVAGEGKTPIKYFELVGHGESSYLIPGVKDDYNGFYPNTFPSEEPKVTYARAKDQQGPQRCWFTRNASGFSISCMGEPFGKEFANNFLRKGANIKTSPGNVNIWARHRGDVTFWAFGGEASPADKEYKRWAQFKSHPQWVTHHGRL